MLFQSETFCFSFRVAADTKEREREREGERGTVIYRLNGGGGNCGSLSRSRRANKDLHSRRLPAGDSIMRIPACTLPELYRRRSEEASSGERAEERNI